MILLHLLDFLVLQSSHHHIRGLSLAVFSHCNRRSITKEEQTHFLFLLLLLVVHKNLEKQNKSLNFAAKQEPKSFKRPSFWCKTENQKKKCLNFAAKHMNRKSKQAFDAKQKMENFVQKPTP
jgi:CRISPR/Cas system-associated endonuclease/helicase Cas3